MNTWSVRGNNLFIGGNTSSGYFPGWIDQVKIYTRGLSAAEVAASYSSGATPTDDLVAWWKCDAISGTTLVSETGTNHGTLRNFAASPSPWSIGRKGSTTMLTYVYIPSGSILIVR